VPLDGGAVTVLATAPAALAEAAALAEPAAWTALAAVADPAALVAGGGAEGAPAGGAEGAEGAEGAAAGEPEGAAAGEDDAPGPVAVTGAVAEPSVLVTVPIVDPARPVTESAGPGLPDAGDVIRAGAG
jgi:hypothetical protein